jgi:hypothetical protein
VRGLDGLTNPVAYLSALSALGPDSPPQTEGAAIVWTVRDENDSVLASESGSALTFAWAGSEAPGVYRINADFALGETIIPLGAVTVTVSEPQVVEERPDVVAAAVVTPTAVATAAATADYDPGNADAVVTILANVRTGPGLNYATLAGGAAAGTQVNVTGRNEDASWLQIVLPDNREGWVASQLLELNPDLDVEPGVPAVVAVVVLHRHRSLLRRSLPVGLNWAGRHTALRILH